MKIRIFKLNNSNNFSTTNWCHTNYQCVWNMMRVQQRCYQKEVRKNQIEILKILYWKGALTSLCWTLRTGAVPEHHTNYKWPEITRRHRYICFYTYIVGTTFNHTGILGIDKFRNMFCHVLMGCSDTWLEIHMFW